MLFYQTTCAAGYECAGFANLQDSTYFRDLGPEPRASANWTPVDLAVEATDERGRPLRSAQVLTPGRTALAIKADAQSAAANYLQQWGEFLPATMQGVPVALFHGTTYVDVFDAERSTIDEPMKILPTEDVVFHSNAEEFDVLTLSTHPTYGLFYSEKIVSQMQADDRFAGLKFIEMAHTL